MGDLAEKTGNSKNDAIPKTSVQPNMLDAIEAVKTLIRWAGDDPAREGLLDTPKRVAKAYKELFKGYEENPEAILKTVFQETSGYDDMVVVKDISFYSHCEHHMVPFHGKAHIGYYPRQGVVGLSKLARLVEVFARRLQTQESMNAQILNAINSALQPRGTAVMLEAEHLCMTMRGVRKQGSTTVTLQFSGIFQTDPHEQARFISLVRNSSALVSSLG